MTNRETQAFARLVLDEGDVIRTTDIIDYNGDHLCIDDVFYISDSGDKYYCIVIQKNDEIIYFTVLDAFAFGHELNGISEDVRRILHP